tara:strand:- start:7094 stop:7477 length:384 start_codon:yes stop_codon:yes gene_type:complete
MISSISIEDARNDALEIMTRAYLELGQNPGEDTIVSFSLILAEDLKRDFDNMEMKDIREAFRIGVRETQEFHLTVKTYYKWIRSHRQVIWDNETVEPEMRDKRLNYRSRNGTGTKKIDNFNIKKLLK